MCEALNSHKDIHTAIKRKKKHMHENDVTKEMRYKAKVKFWNHLWAGCFGLSENL